MNKIGTKLFASFLFMAAVTIGLLWLIQAGIFRDSTLKGRIESVRNTIEKAIQDGEDDWEDLRQNLNVNLIIFNEDGSTRSVTQGMPMMGMMVRTCQAMIPDEVDGTPRLVHAASGAGRYALIGFQAPDKSYLFAVFSVADYDEAARILRNQLWLVTAVLVLAAVVLAIVLTRMFSRPIRAVTTAARRLAAGRYDPALPVRSRDEIGKLTEALNELSVQLQKTDLLQKELIANVSHELRAPLAVIQGYAETVRDVTWPDEDKRTQQLGVISDEARRLSRIVKDILDYSRLQAGVEPLVLSEFDVCAVLDSLASKYHLEAAAKGLTIRSSCPDHGLRIVFDREKFEQVMNNLISNAINHADAGSEIIASALKTAEVIRIGIQNSGENIPGDEIGRIWDRYYQGRSNQEGRRLGTGLGLAIVRSILERHRVAYGVESKNRKTVFWFESVHSSHSQPSA